MTDRMNTKEAIWQGQPEGLRDALAAAEELTAAGQFVRAHVISANAWYSYASSFWVVGTLQRPKYLKRARHHALEAYRLSGGGEDLSAEQCDVVATVLATVSRHRDLARKTYLHGLNSIGPAHVEALLYVGHAELAQKNGSDDAADTQARTALTYRSAVHAEPDQVQAMRQWMRVLRRAALVLARHDGDQAEKAFREAWRLARDPRFGSASQRGNLWLSLPLLLWKLSTRFL